MNKFKVRDENGIEREATILTIILALLFLCLDFEVLYL